VARKRRFTRAKRPFASPLVSNCNFSAAADQHALALVLIESRAHEKGAIAQTKAHAALYAGALANAMRDRLLLTIGEKPLARGRRNDLAPEVALRHPCRLQRARLVA
jgi:hypothetical protein